MASKKSLSGMVPSVPYVFTSEGKPACFFCQQPDRPLLGRLAKQVTEDSDESAVLLDGIGICESCTVLVTRLWKSQLGDVPPGFAPELESKVTRLYVALPKRSATQATLNGRSVEVKCDPFLPNSYSFLTMVQPSGSLGLPSSDLKGDEQPGDLKKIAIQLLETNFKIATWPFFIEPMYTAYTPRGQLATVMLVSAWHGPAQSMWRPWPFEMSTVGAMSGFYKAMEAVWSLRVFKHNITSKHTEEFSVYLREAAVKYIVLQQQVRSNVKEVDTSMLAIYRKVMTPDESLIAAALLDYEAKDRELQDQKAEKAIVSQEEEGHYDESTVADDSASGEVDDGDVSPTEPSSEEEDDSTTLESEDDDSSTVDNDEPGDLNVSSPAAEAGAIVATPAKPSKPSSPSPARRVVIDDDDDEWPELGIKPSSDENIIEAEYQDITPTKANALAAELGFVRPARPLTTNPK